jgi:hypothetical protein
MNFSRLLPFLPLLLLLPATSGAAPLIPSSDTYAGLNPSDLCPLVQIVEHKLCDNAAHNNFTDLCILLQKYNTSFCSKNVENMQVTEPLSNAVLSIRTLENEFHKDNNNTNDNDMRKLCPVIYFIEQELCTSLHAPNHVDFQFDPKELCPLLNITYTELCS